MLTLNVIVSPYMCNLVQLPKEICGKENAYIKRCILRILFVLRGSIGPARRVE